MACKIQETSEEKNVHFLFSRKYLVWFLPLFPHEFTVVSKVMSVIQARFFVAIQFTCPSIYVDFPPDL